MSSQMYKEIFGKAKPKLPSLVAKAKKLQQWYCNVPLGKNTLDNLLGRTSKKAGLSTHFTSHCIRVTSVTILKAAGLENSRVRSVTGHKSDASIESYNERPTIVSNFVAPAKASQANAPLRVTAQSRSPLRALQQNQSQDEIHSINQQSNVGAQQTNVAQNFSLGTFQNCTFNFYGQSA